LEIRIDGDERVIIMSKIEPMQPRSFFSNSEACPDREPVYDERAYEELSNPRVGCLEILKFPTAIQHIAGQYPV
jgi:hypothetical protein